MWLGGQKLAVKKSWKIDMQIIFPGCCYIKYSENG